MIDTSPSSGTCDLKLVQTTPLQPHLAAASNPVQWLEGLWGMTVSPASALCAPDASACYLVHLLAT